MFLCPWNSKFHALGVYKMHLPDCNWAYLILSKGEEAGHFVIMRHGLAQSLERTKALNQIKTMQQTPKAMVHMLVSFKVCLGCFTGS